MAEKKSRAAARKIKDKWKAKVWYNLLAPEMFNKQALGETPTDDPGKLVGRVTEVTVQDLTGDGAPDTLALRAFGHRGDSLNIAFTITSRGAEVFRESWTSSYELIDPPLPPNPPLATVDSYIRGQLKAEFGHVHIEPFDTSAFSKPRLTSA